MARNFPGAAGSYLASSIFAPTIDMSNHAISGFVRRAATMANNSRIYSLLYVGGTGNDYFGDVLFGGTTGYIGDGATDLWCGFTTEAEGYGAADDNWHACAWNLEFDTDPSPFWSYVDGTRTNGAAIPPKTGASPALVENTRQFVLGPAQGGVPYQLAEVGIWNRTLSNLENYRLTADKWSPLLIPDGLVASYTMSGTGGEVDRTGNGYDLAEVGAVGDYADHPTGILSSLSDVIHGQEPDVSETRQSNRMHLTPVVFESSFPNAERTDWRVQLPSNITTPTGYMEDHYRTTYYTTPDGNDLNDEQNALHVIGDCTYALLPLPALSEFDVYVRQWTNGSPESSWVGPSRIKSEFGLPSNERGRILSGLPVLDYTVTQTATGSIVTAQERFNG